MAPPAPANNPRTCSAQKPIRAPTPREKKKLRIPPRLQRSALPTVIAHLLRASRLQRCAPRTCSPPHLQPTHHKNQPAGHQLRASCLQRSAPRTCSPQHLHPSPRFGFVREMC